MISLNKLLISALAGTQLVSADFIESPTIEEQSAYPEWAFVMTPWVEEYSWMPIEVTTEDGYILTMFKVSKRFSDCESTESVLFHNGIYADSVDWVEGYNGLHPGVKSHVF